jgi:AcrR family transcriptional regulator
LSIKAVAEQAGVSRQAVHYHFRDAAGLRAALGIVEASADGEDASTRQRLVAAAIRVLSRPAGGEASLEAIATEAGLTKGAIYHHFEDRNALLRAVAGNVSPVGEIIRAIEQSEDRPVREGLVALARAYHEALADRADLIRNLVANASRDPALGAIVFDEVVTRGAPVILAWFGRQIAAGTIRPIDPTLVVQALFGPAFMPIMLGPWISTLLEQLGTRPAVERLDEYIDLLMAGIAPDAPARPAPSDALPPAAAPEAPNSPPMP